MYFIYDNISNGYNIAILNVLYILSITSGIFVITTKNPIVSVLFLITLFFNVACFLIVLGLNFIGLSYLLIYVGAVSILFLFILMLINIRISELLSNTRNSVPLILIVFILVSFIMLKILPVSYNNISTHSYSGINHYYVDLILNNDIGSNTYYSSSINNINFTSTFLWDGNILEFNPITSIGNIMYTAYPMWLIITSLILLLAMIGVIVITLNSSENNDSTNNYKVIYEN